MAHLYKHKVHGWRVEFKIPRQDGTGKLKTKYAKHRTDIEGIFAEANKLEHLISNKALTLIEAKRYVAAKYLTLMEMQDILSMQNEVDPGLQALIDAKLSPKQKAAFVEFLKTLP